MKNLIVLDCESYPNYFLIAFKNVSTGDVLTFDIRGEDKSFTEEEKKKILGVLKRNETFGFNSLNYDIPVIYYALKGGTPSEIFEMSNDIIQNGLRSWQTFEQYHLTPHKKVDHFDISEPAPGVRIGLKMYGARLHSQTLWDLPYAVGSTLTHDEQDKVKQYCLNDLSVTVDLYNKVKPQMDLRRGMIDDYGYEVMSKSDAQMAEMIFKKQLSAKGITNFKAPSLDDDYTIKYKAPSYIRFKDDNLRNLLNFIQCHEFKLDENGGVILPDELEKMKIRIGNADYKIGIGGLHSCEKSQIVLADDDHFLIDKDVVGYYPSIILNLGLYPEKLGKEFLNTYGGLRTERTRAKKRQKEIEKEISRLKEMLK